MRKERERERNIEQDQSLHLSEELHKVNVLITCRLYSYVFFCILCYECLEMELKGPRDRKSVV